MKKRHIFVTVYIIAIVGLFYLSLQFLTSYLYWGALFWPDGKTDMNIVNRNINISGISFLVAFALDAYLVFRFWRFLKRGGKEKTNTGSRR